MTDFSPSGGEGPLGPEWCRVTLACIGDAVITTDAKGNVTYLNPVAEALTGWSLQEGTGRSLESVFRIVDEALRSPAENPALRSLREGVITGLANHTLLIARDGTEWPIDDSAAPIRSASGEILGAVLVFRDITTRRRLEWESASRLADAQLLSSIVESSNDAIVSKTLDGIIQSWNAAAERLFGYTATQAIGQHISLIIPHERAAEEDAIVAKLRAGERIEHYETERRRSDGALVQVSLTISPLYDENGQIIGASKIARDITQSRKSEHDLQESEERFRTLADNISQFAWMADEKGWIFWYNQRWYDYTGTTLEEMQGWGWRKVHHPDHVERVVERIQHSWDTGELWEDTFPLRGRDGTYRWFLSRAIPIRDDAGNILRWFGTNTDITEQRVLEENLRRLAADLSEADRRKNEFLAMLAHELRNPLAPIRNGVQLLQLSNGEDPQIVRSATEMLERQVTQMVSLIDDLMDVSRISRGKIELRKARVELAPLVHQAVEGVRPQLESLNQQLSITLPAKPVYLDADRTRLTQILGNLLNNASKFTDQGGQIRLVVEQGSDQAIGDCVTIRVQDTGIGISPEQFAKIFEMFGQLDDQAGRTQSGLGIGLALAKNLIELHGGTIEVQSEGLNRGSEFVVHLPVASQPAKPTEPKPKKAHVLAGQKVLVVDDNQDAASTLQTLLKLSGAETKTANDGQEALDTAAAFQPEVVLLDLGLPTLDGFEVCRALRCEPWAQETVIVALTGWGQAEDHQKTQQAGFDAHLVKPVDLTGLMELLTKLCT